MIKQKQLFRHDPDNSVYGDCHRTAIACLLEIQPEDVPHIGKAEWEDTTGEKFHRFYRRYLSDVHKLRVVEIAFSDSLDRVLATLGTTAPGAYYILGGTSANGVGHSVIGCGGEIVWDPSIDNSGIIGPHKEDGMYWISYLVPEWLTDGAPVK